MRAILVVAARLVQPRVLTSIRHHPALSACRPLFGGKLQVMSKPLDRRGLLRMGLPLAALVLAQRARACEVVAEHVRVVHPWTRATAPGAGHAVLCMTIDQVTGFDRLVGVSTPIADGAEMGGVGSRPGVDYPVYPGGEFVLDEDGTYIRLTGLRHALVVGREYPLQLEFERSGIVLASLSVDFDVRAP
jgi:copper(I)-binding protein